MTEKPDPQQAFRNDMLISAIKDGCSFMALTLLQYGADPHQSGEPMIAAAQAGDINVVHTLWRMGARIDALDHMPLRVAAANGHTAVVKLLLEAGADYSVHDHQPLREAETGGHDEVAHILRDAGSYNPRGPDDTPAARRAFYTARALKRLGLVEPPLT
jgi:ankyrin repeat protein